MPHSLAASQQIHWNAPEALRLVPVLPGLAHTVPGVQDLCPSPSTGSPWVDFRGGLGALSIPGEDLTSHLDACLPCSFSSFGGAAWYRKHLGQKVCRSVILIIFYSFNYHDCSA